MKARSTQRPNLVPTSSISAVVSNSLVDRTQIVDLLMFGYGKIGNDQPNPASDPDYNRTSRNAPMILRRRGSI